MALMQDKSWALVGILIFNIMKTVLFIFGLGEFGLGGGGL